MTAAAPETPATPGQAAYEAYLAHLQGADPGYGQWVKPFAAIDKHDRDAWEAAAIAARQPQPAPGNAVTRTRLGHALAALREIAEQLDDDPPGTARNALDDDAALRNGGEQPAPELTQSAYLYHCKFGGPGGDEYGLFWRKEDADAAAANRAGEGCTQVLGMAILGTRPEPQPAPGLAAAMAETLDVRNLLDVATTVTLARARQFLPAPLVAQLHRIREQGSLPSLEGK